MYEGQKIGTAALGEGVYGNRLSQSAGAAECRQSEVYEQLSGVQRQIGQLQDVVSGLSARLNPVLRPLNQASNQAKPEKVLVPLAGDLRACSEKLADLNGQLSFLLNNIEL